MQPPPPPPRARAHFRAHYHCELEPVYPGTHHIEFAVVTKLCQQELYCIKESATREANMLQDQNSVLSVQPHLHS